MTLKEAKNNIARGLGYTDWETVDWYQIDSIEQNIQKPYAFEQYSDKAAKLYARSKWDEACDVMRSEMNYDTTNPEFKP